MQHSLSPLHTFTPFLVNRAGQDKNLINVNLFVYSNNLRSQDEIIHQMLILHSNQILF